MQTPRYSLPALISGRAQLQSRAKDLCSWLLPLLVTCIVILNGAIAIAEMPSSDQVNTQPTEAPVILGDETLFHIQARIASFSPEFRAQVVSSRIYSFAKDSKIDTDSLYIVNNEQTETTDIKIRGVTLVTLADVDAVAAGIERQALAKLYLDIIESSVTRFRATYSIPNILWGVLYTIITTVAFIASVIVINKSLPITYRYLRIWRSRWIPSLKLLGVEILSSDRVADFITETIKLLRWGILLNLLYFYINLTLSFFPWTKGLSRILFGYVAAAFSTLVSRLVTYLPNLFFLAIIVISTNYSLKVLRFLSTEIKQGHLTFPGFYSEWAQPTYKLLQFTVLAFAASVAFPYLPGSETPAFQGISIFLGVLLSLGSSSTIANVLSGIILTYTRAFKEGDRVQITDTVGDVVDKALFVTRIRTIKNVVITIPNSSVLSSHIINYSAAVSDPQAPPLILHTTITLGYDIPWRKVHEALTKAAIKTSLILPEPAPFVLQTSLGDFYISYELNAYTQSPGVMAKIYSELHQHIQDQCNEADIEILSPHYRAVRDGNETTIPAEYLPEDYQAPGFRVQSIDSLNSPGAQS